MSRFYKPDKPAWNPLPELPSDCSYDESQRIHIIDADSVLYICAHGAGEDVELAKFNVSSMLERIQNIVEQRYNIVNTLIFVGGGRNFRHDWYPDYKKHRPEKSSTVKALIAWFPESYPNCICSNFGETDDCVYAAYKLSDANCVVSAIDKDVKMFCHSCPVFDYRKSEFQTVTAEESRIKIAQALLIGDSGDNINFTKGIGKKYAEEHILAGMTDYQLIKNVLLGYLKVYKGDMKEAKEKLKLCYKLIKLYDKNPE